MRVLCTLSSYVLATMLASQCWSQDQVALPDGIKSNIVVKTTGTTQPTGAPSAEIASLVEPLAKAHEGDVAVAVLHLKTGEHYELNGDRPQGTASLIKFPVMIEAYRQAEVDSVRLFDAVEMHAEDMVQGSGILTSHFSPGARFTLRDAIRLMIAFSDNTATNLVVDKIGLPSTAATMSKWGYPETRIHAKVFKRDTSIAPERSERYGLGSTTANDMVGLLAKLHAGELVSPAMSKEMLQHLEACDDKLKFPALLPKGTKIAHKTGSVAKIRTAAGIIESASGPFALCVLTENNRDTRWTDDNAGDRLCAQIAKVTFDYFSRKEATGANNSSTTTAGAAAGAAVLEKGATGDMVEALQRTLNARLQANGSGLSVDGDFGPGTEAAVKSFQTSKGLPDTGVVDAATWKALGPLMLEESPVDDPDTINNEKLASEPADDPNGPPAVTCKAWVIADANTGKTLWGNGQDKQLDIASTTKIMTAYLVMSYCQAHPEALEEMLTFSERADKTMGSTSGIKTGETLKVRELLYGLMLPSGNDASVAFAEHFGYRLADDKSVQVKTTMTIDERQASYEQFIAAMNRAAEQLQMTSTHYANPHGLTAPGHASSCEDLVKLTIAARKLDLFREVTSCRQYGCRVKGNSGYERNVKWTNTNQLLPIEGYKGVKTGTTDAAGACLVSIGEYKDRQLIVVVLGSVASPARYTDSRNLYAWAWRQLKQ